MRLFRFQCVVFVVLYIGCLAANASSSSFVSLIMPGDVAQAHAEFELECDKCHVVGNLAAQPGLCGECHEEVLADVEYHQGYHGRLLDPECQLCHFEHHGRDAILAPLNTGEFDHTPTDFPLQGKHADLACVDCHDGAHKFAETASECSICHSENDIHLGALGEACADCHDASGWQNGTMDHLDVAGFALNFSHAEVTCTACHEQHKYEDTPTTCYGCHAAIDDDTGHKGNFGTDCQQCHQESTWQDTLFVHNRDTGFELQDLHATATCTSCHIGKLFEVETPTQCVDCHREDDPHVGSLGLECAACHSALGWTRLHFQHDRDTSFGLDGRHRDVECAGCHEDTTFQTSLPTECVGCHLADDSERGHQGRFGEACDTCHTPAEWSEWTFDHDTTRFPLVEGHVTVACDSCHENKYFQTPPRECVGCHAGDDIHRERLGLRCGQCHRPQAWLEVDFDHLEQAEFDLVGAHAEITCVACHVEPVSGQIEIPTTCYDCHADEDVHFGTLSNRCGACHKSTDWREVLPDARTWSKSGGPPEASGGEP